MDTRVFFVLVKFCLATIGVCVFRCADFGWRTFCMLVGGYMSKHISKKVIDITGIELTPGQPAVCLGNGEHGFECCCDECDYYLLFFPQFDSKNKKEITAKNQVTI